MPRVGFEPTIPAFERAKTVHVLDCAATVIGSSYNRLSKHLDPSLKCSKRWLALTRHIVLHKENSGTKC
jgi:hypothetical protein